MTKERPILFSAPMVLAILEGKKTMTRRAVKPQPQGHCWEKLQGYKLSAKCFDTSAGFSARFQHSLNRVGDEPLWVTSPYGKPGDRLYVKEKHKYYDWTEDGEPFIQYAADDAVRLCRVDSDAWGEKIMEIWAKLSMPKNYLIERRACDQKWRPSIFMPRWASRIPLEITGVKVERLQDISEEDARSEGIIDGGCLNCGNPEPCNCSDPYPGARDAFIHLWNSINGKTPGKAWDDNPFVWVVSFKKLSEEY